MAPRDPLVHIGFHKTGSTWLQAELFHRDSQDFVPLSRDGHPKYLGSHFIRDEEGYLLSSFVIQSERIRGEVADLLEALGSDDRIPVVSNERLSGTPYSSAFDARLIADRIHAALPNARILIVVREQCSMILSTYLQYLQVGGVDRLSKFLDRRYDGHQPGFSPNTLKYDGLVAHYHNLFGRERILTLPYELLSRDPAALVARISRFVDRPLPFANEQLSKRHNVAKKDWVRRRLPEVNFLARPSSVNAHSPLHVSGFNRAVDWTNRWITRFARVDDSSLKRQVREWVEDRYCASNRALSELMGEDLSQYGYRL